MFWIFGLEWNQKFGTQNLWLACRELAASRSGSEFTLTQTVAVFWCASM